MLERRDFLKRSVLGALAIRTSLGRAEGAPDSSVRPNILWVFAEDICPDLSCYGTKGVATPNLDRLAEQGIRYENAFTTAPVCSPARSAMMTGCHQNFIGANQHRTRRRNKKHLPDPVRTLPDLLQDAGYYTFVKGKKDLNFKHGSLSTGGKVLKRSAGQPFFMQRTITRTHRSFRRGSDEARMAELELPPYYPDTPLMRRDWANYLKTMESMDKKMGKIMEWLTRNGLYENTMVVFVGDHGRCMPRGKQFLYDGGIHVPLIIRWPGHIEAGQVYSSLVSSIDIAPTVLDAAGVDIPDWMHGRSLLDENNPPREYIFAARDKMDNTHDAMRAVRTDNFKYILNLMPERPWCQFNEYKEKKYPSLALLNVMHLKGELTPEQDRFMQASKPEEELFDLRKDPYEIHNLAGNPKYEPVLNKMRQLVSDWRLAIEDKGVTEKFRSAGWPASYPTRSLAQWEGILAGWKEYLFERGAPPIKAKGATEYPRNPF